MGRRIINLIILTLLLVSQINSQVVYSTSEPDFARDAFGRLRISEPTTLHDAQFTYSRRPFVFDTITTNGTVTWANPVLYKVVTGQALSSPAAAVSVSTYSAFETIIGGTSGSPTRVLSQGVVPATIQSKSVLPVGVGLKTPITLRHDGTQHNNGRFTVLVQGIGGTSAVHVIVNWK